MSGLIKYNLISSIFLEVSTVKLHNPKKAAAFTHNPTILNIICVEKKVNPKV